MAEETTQATTNPKGTDEVPEGAALPESDAQAAAPAAELPPDNKAVDATQTPDTTPSDEATQAAQAQTEEGPAEPDALQPFIDKAKEATLKEVDDEAVDKFLRGHIKTFREEWDIWSDTAKDAYVHMMTSQLLRRKAEGTQISLYQPYVLPVPSAQTKLWESIKQSQIKPKRCIPVLLLPPNLRPTYSLKK